MQPYKFWFYVDKKDNSSYKKEDKIQNLPVELGSLDSVMIFTPVQKGKLY